MDEQEFNDCYCGVAVINSEYSMHSHSYHLAQFINLTILFLDMS
jgi:hypothetical protein